MKRRIKRKWFSVWAFDVETHADPESVAKLKTGVWLYSFINDKSTEEDESNYGTSIEEFLDRLEEKTTPKKRNHHGKENEPVNLLIYIWNLSFEWSFILPVLLKRGFSYNPDFEESEFCYDSITTKTCSSVWEARLKFGKGNGIVIFRDLAKIFPGKLATVAKSFGLPTQKGEIDYKKFRAYEGYVPTQEEKIYNFKDTRIIMEILMEMDRRNDVDFWNSISAASYTMRKAMAFSYPKAYRPLEKYREKYPVLGKEESDFISHSVAGGLTYCPDQWQFKEIEGRIGHIDFHQSHPSRMASMHGERFPYGFGEYGEGEPKCNHREMACCHVKVSYSTAKLHSVISLIGMEAVSGKELWLWDFEISCMKLCYNDLDIVYIDYYKYKWSYLPWRGYCKENYEKRLEAKKKGDTFEVYHRKLLNNSLYGKLLENGHPIRFENYVDEQGAIDSIEHPVEDPPIGGKYTYKPVGSAIPAYSRVALIRAGLKLGWENILYMDTDSLFFILNKETIAKVKTLEINDKMGSFGWEDVDENGFTKLTGAQFTAPKRYKLKDDDGTFDVKMAGVSNPKEDLNGNELGYEEVNMIDGTFSAHSRKRAEGGTLILDVPKKLQVQEKYRRVYQRNKK